MEAAIASNQEKINVEVSKASEESSSKVSASETLGLPSIYNTTSIGMVLYKMPIVTIFGHK